MTNQSLKNTISQMADAAYAAGVHPDDCVGFVRQNCNYKPDQEFFLVFLLGCELGERRKVKEQPCQQK